MDFVFWDRQDLKHHGRVLNFVHAVIGAGIGFREQEVTEETLAACRKNSQSFAAAEQERLQKLAESAKPKEEKPAKKKTGSAPATGEAAGKKKGKKSTEAGGTSSSSGTSGSTSRSDGSSSSGAAESG